MIYGFNKSLRLEKSHVEHTYKYSLDVSKRGAMLYYTDIVEHTAKQVGRYVGLTKRGAYDCAAYLDSLWRLNYIGRMDPLGGGLFRPTLGYASLCPVYTIQNDGGAWYVDVTIEDNDVIEYSYQLDDEQPSIPTTQQEIKDLFDIRLHQITPAGYLERPFIGD